MSTDGFLVLALQTVAEPTEIALLEGERILATCEIAERFAVCRQLVPQIAALLAGRAKGMQELDLIGVGIGPGSFTGIRIGVGTAKALAHALEKPLFGVNTLEALAFSISPKYASIIALLEAGRGKYFAGCYNRGLQLLSEPAVLNAEELKTWLEAARPPAGGETAPSSCVVCGAIDQNIRKFAEEYGVEIVDNSISAAMVGKLALRKFTRRGGDSPLALQPLYLRASTPEERASSAIADGN